MCPMCEIPQHSSILPVFLPSLEHVWHSLPSHQVRKFHSRNSSQLLAFHQQFVDFVISLLDTCMPRPLHRMGRGGKGEKNVRADPTYCHHETLWATPQEARTNNSRQCLWHGSLGCQKAKLTAFLSVGKSEGCETKIQTHSLGAMNYSSKPSL